MRGTSSIVRALTAAVAGAALLLTTACGADVPSVTSGNRDQGGEPSSPASAINYPTEPTVVVISLGQIFIAGDGRVFRFDDAPAGDAEEPESAPESGETGARTDGTETAGATVDATGTAGLVGAAPPATIRAGRPIATVDLAPPTPQPFTVAQITPAGMDALLAEADRLGILDGNTDPDPYDMLPTILTIRVEGGEYQHVTVGLSDYDNSEVREFGDTVRDLERFLGDDIGPIEPYVPHAWRIDSTYTQPDEPIRPWPLGEEPTSNGCVVLPSEPDRDTATGGYATGMGAVGAFPTLPWQCLDVAETTGASTPAGTYDHPTDADHVLIQTGWVTLTGDGTIYRYVDPRRDVTPNDADEVGSGSDSSAESAGEAYAVITSSPPLEMAQISPDGVAALLTEADRLGLLTGDYLPRTSDPDPAVLEIDLGSTRRGHALVHGADHPKAVAAVDFDRLLRDPDTFLGSEIGPWRGYVPHAWTLTEVTGIADGETLDWPLADSPAHTSCVVLPSASDQDTAAALYLHDDRIFLAAPALPWECA